MARATRTELIAEAAERDATVIASHIDAPGQIEIRDGHGVWVDLG